MWAVSIAWLLFFQGSDDIHSKTGTIEYRLEVDTSGLALEDGVAKIVTNLGYEVVLSKAVLNLEQMQLYECEHSHGYRWHQSAWAGHSSSEVNPAEVRDIQSFDLLEPESQQFSASLDEPEYCTFHMVFARDVQVDGPSLVLEGKYSLSGGDPVLFKYESQTAYGKNIDINALAEGGVKLGVIFAVKDAFGGIDFADSPSADDVARSVFEGMLRDVSVSVGSSF